jgi:hypothetical protein
MPRRILSAPAVPFFAVSLTTVAVIGTATASHASAQLAPEPQRTLYKNDEWHFEIAVPAEIKIANVQKTGEEEILQFSDSNADHVFQIEAAPYTQMDVALGEEGSPNGADDQSTQLGIVNVVRLDNFDVSFHHKGITYSVSSVGPDVKTWLLPILQSWDFTN